MATKAISINTYLNTSALAVGFEQYEFMYPSEINMNPDKYEFPLLLRIPVDLDYDVVEGVEMVRLKFMATDKLDQTTSGNTGDYTDRNTIWESLITKAEALIALFESDARGNAAPDLIIVSDRVRIIKDYLGIFNFTDVTIHFEATVKMC